MTFLRQDYNPCQVYTYQLLQSAIILPFLVLCFRLHALSLVLAAIAHQQLSLSSAQWNYFSADGQWSQKAGHMSVNNCHTCVI